MIHPLSSVMMDTTRRYDVKLNIYDIWPTSYEQFGVAHVGVLVGDVEYAFGIRGIYKELPKHSVCTLGGKFVPEVSIGSRTYAPEDIYAKFMHGKLGRMWRRGTYHLLRKNCITFSKWFTQNLVEGGGGENLWPIALNRLIANLRAIPEALLEAAKVPGLIVHAKMDEIRSRLEDMASHGRKIKR